MKSIKRSILVLLTTVGIPLLLASCSPVANIVSGRPSETETELTTALPETEAVSATVSQDDKTAVSDREWQAAFQGKLQALLDENYPIISSYISDTDNNGIPEVSVLYHGYYLLPQLVFTYCGGKIISLEEPENTTGGSSIKAELLYAQGTNYVVNRSYGTSSGTFGYHEAWIYAFDSTGYHVVKEISDDDIGMTFNGDLNDSDETGQYQKKLSAEIDKRIYAFVGNVKLVSYEDVCNKYSPVSDLCYELKIELNPAIKTWGQYEGLTQCSEAYKKFLRANASSFGGGSFCEYSVYDIDSDNMPELIIKSGSCEADYLFEFYTYRDGSVKPVGQISGGHSGLYVNSEDDVAKIYRQFAQMGGECLYEVRIADGKISEKLVFERETDGYLSLSGLLKTYPPDDYSGLIVHK